MTLPQEGTVWHGEETPASTITESGTLWTSPATEPCSECAANDGLVFLDLPKLPAHTFCSCHGTSVEVTFTHQSRTVATENTEDVRVYRGSIPEVDSSVTGAPTTNRTRTYNLPNGDSIQEDCPGDSWTATSRCATYFVYRVTTTVYRDTYLANKALDGGSTMQKSAVKVVTRFHDTEHVRE